MARSYAQRVRALEAAQAQRQAAVQAMARARVLRDALDALDPQPDDVHLDYGGRLDRLAEVVGVERRRVAQDAHEGIAAKPPHAWSQRDRPEERR